MAVNIFISCTLSMYNNTYFDQKGIGCKACITVFSLLFCRATRETAADCFLVSLHSLYELHFVISLNILLKGDAYLLYSTSRTACESKIIFDGVLFVVAIA